MVEKREAAVRRVATRRYWRAADARVVVEAWQRSGESAAVFARRYRVHATRLTRWAARLAPAHPGPVAFHPVRVVGAGAPAPPAPIEVVLPDGCAVRVPPGWAAEDLAQVIRALVGPRPC